MTGQKARTAMSPPGKDDELPDECVGALQQTVALVVVMSPAYLASARARLELQTFLQACEKQGTPALASKRIFKVVKRPVSPADDPLGLDSLLGYTFFSTDAETGRRQEFDEIFGPDAQREFWLRLDDLTHDLASVLMECRAPGD